MQHPNRRISKSDLEHILQKTSSLWDDIRDKTILITGGTGFFGKWLLESFIYVNDTLLLNAKGYVLSRNPTSFLETYPQFHHPAVAFIKGDIADFSFPDVPLHYIIHAATEASVSLNVEQPFFMFDTIVEGTKNVLRLAHEKKVVAVLHTSSGAVYGKQDSHITHISEEAQSSPDIYSKSAAYAEGKRVAEMLSALYYYTYGVPSKIARCFAFVGPYLPLDAHFAIGNFIKNVLDNSAINVNGDGTPYRSYLYAADLAVWLWTILLKGEPGRPYNVGSDEDITLKDLSLKVVHISDKNLAVDIKQKPVKGISPSRYVPCVERSKKELGLNILIPLDQAIHKTIQFYE